MWNETPTYYGRELSEEELRALRTAPPPGVERCAAVEAANLDSPRITQRTAAETYVSARERRTPLRRYVRGVVLAARECARLMWQAATGRYEGGTR